MLRLIKGADTVELKLTVPDSDYASVVAALGMDVLDAEIRQIMFFDTPELAPNKQGVVVRARRIQGKPSDSVVKLRPVVPDDLSAKLRKSPNFGVEVDAMPGGFVCSGSMKAKELDPLKAKEAFAGQRRTSKLFTKETTHLLRRPRHWGASNSTLFRGGNRSTQEELKLRLGGFRRRLVAELWFSPQRIADLKLSTKCAPA